jgi:hypothetical protein
VTEALHAVEQVRRDRVTEIYNDLDQKITSEPSLKGDLDKARLIFPRLGGLPTVSIRGVHYGQVQDLEEIHE